MDEPFNPLRELHEQKRAGAASRFGFDKLSDDQIIGAAVSILCSLPKDRLRAHLTKLAASQSKLDRLRGKELSYLLFVIDEIEKSMLELSPEDACEILIEMIGRNR